MDSSGQPGFVKKGCFKSDLVLSVHTTGKCNLIQGEGLLAALGSCGWDRAATPYLSLEFDGGEWMLVYGGLANTKCLEALQGRSTARKVPRGVHLGGEGGDRVLFLFHPGHTAFKDKQVAGLKNSYDIDLLQEADPGYVGNVFVIRDVQVVQGVGPMVFKVALASNNGAKDHNNAPARIESLSRRSQHVYRVLLAKRCYRLGT